MRTDAVDEQLHVDPALIDAIRCMEGHGYVPTLDYSDPPTMNVAASEAGGLGAMRQQR